MLRLRKFMFERVYLGAEARSEHDRVRRTLTGLFEHYLAHPEDVPEGAPGADDVQRDHRLDRGDDRPVLHRDLPAAGAAGGVAPVGGARRG